MPSRTGKQPKSFLPAYGPPGKKQGFPARGLKFEQPSHKCLEHRLSGYVYRTWGDGPPIPRRSWTMPDYGLPEQGRMGVPPNPPKGTKQAGETARVPDTRKAAGGRQKRGKAVTKQGLPNCANPCPCPAWGEPSLSRGGSYFPRKGGGGNLHP